MNATDFRLALEPMPTPRPRTRVIQMAGRKPLAVIYSPREYQAWQATAARLLAALPPTPITGPCAVKIVCEVERPRTSKLPAPKPDVDNYAKGVLDAITKDGRFWSDDSQVVHLTVVKRWAIEAPGISVEISEIG